MRLLLLTEHKENKYFFEKMLVDFYKEQAFPKGSLHPKDTSFLIECENKIVGFAAARLEEECFPDEDLPEICEKVSAFYIAPEFRGKTLGRQAFKLLRQWGRDNKAAIIEIAINKDLDSSRMFLKEQGLELAGSGKKDLFRGFI